MRRFIVSTLVLTATVPFAAQQAAGQVNIVIIPQDPQVSPQPSQIPQVPQQVPMTIRNGFLLEAASVLVNGGFATQLGPNQSQTLWVPYGSTIDVNPSASAGVRFFANQGTVLVEPSGFFSMQSRFSWVN